MVQCYGTSLDNTIRSASYETIRDGDAVQWKSTGTLSNMHKALGLIPSTAKN